MLFSCSPTTAAAMDDARQIVLQALEQAGVPLPDTGLQFSFDLSPSVLVSIASAALALIRHLPLPPPIPFPHSMADRFRICSELASSIKDLGYGADISFHHFLYPSEEETHKILRFLLDNIYRSDGDRDSRNERLTRDSSAGSTLLEDQFENLSVEGEKSGILIEKSTFKRRGSSYAAATTSSSEISDAEEWSHGYNMGFPQQDKQDEGEHYQTSSIVISRTEKELKDLELGTLEEILKKISIENKKQAKDVMDLEEHFTQLEVDWGPSAKHLELLKRDYYLLEVALHIALGSSEANSDKLKELTNSISDSKLQRDTLNAKWENTLQELEGHRTSLEVFASNGREQAQLKFDQLKVTRDKIDEVTAMLKLREEQLDSLTVKLVRTTRGPPRNFYVKRITELIKNSKKLDNDISRIIGEIRDLQRESNVNQGRLKRIYALVDEVIFRDAKRESLSRQAYRFLTSLHENFSDCYDKVFSIDRVQGEISELQATIESLEKKPVDLKKLQADIDVIMAENRSLSFLKI